MPKLSLTKHNFTLEQDEFDYLCWRASAELRTVNNALRMSLRELYDKHKVEVTNWRNHTGKTVPEDEGLTILMEMVNEPYTGEPK